MKRNIKYYVTGNVGILLLTWLLYAIGNAITIPYFSIYLKMLGANAVDIGLTYSVSIIVQLITIIPGGYLTDTLGRRSSIVMGTWLITATSFLMVIAPNWQLLAVFYALNMAAAFYQPALLAILIDSLPRERYASGILITSILPQVPWLILPPIGGFLINEYGLLGIRLAYLISSIISVIVAVIRQFTIKETLGNRTSKISLREFLHSYYQLGNVAHLPNDLLITYLSALLVSIAVMPINTLLSIYVVYKLGLSTIYWGYLTSLSYAAYILIGIFLAFYVDRYRSKLLILGVIINVVGSAIGLIENVYSTIGYLLMLQIGTQLIMTAIQSELGNRIGINQRGHGMSLLIIFQLIGQIIGSYVTGELYRVTTESLFLIPLVLSLTLMIIINLGRRINYAGNMN
ncbi:MFS transporter [Vulcanisaeta sp. JCM 16161]|uniref:MFS transporter n=1 Tax=Vulcanisaeta sp. JCM 16161 TaxID=1295372 RepID=UPI000A757E61|nr:MFS transporter [Vulcanisaeta sp. JCM 16161]